MQCQDCQYFHRTSRGDIRLECDPFSTIVEPECLTKWQLVRINQMVASYQATLDYYRKLAPMQEKMFKAMERELDDMSESESWKVQDEDGDSPDEDDDRSSGNPWGQKF